MPSTFQEFADVRDKAGDDKAAKDGHGPRAVETPTMDSNANKTTNCTIPEDANISYSYDQYLPSG